MISEIRELVEMYTNGLYSSKELYYKLSTLTPMLDMELIVREIPETLRGAFVDWVVGMYDNDIPVDGYVTIGSDPSPGEVRNNINAIRTWLHMRRVGTAHKRVRLKYVGNFAELGYHDDPNAQSLHAARGRRSAENKQLVVEYLRRAQRYSISPGYERDIFDPTKRAGSASTATDGVYVWPLRLAYYVENYDVELPDDFEKHMETNQWKSPAVDVLALELPEPILTPREG